MKILPSSRFGQKFNEVLEGDRFRTATNNLSFGTVGKPDNIQGFMASGTTPAGAGTEFEIKHNLGYIPLGFIVFMVDQDARIYKGTTAWTGTSVFLKCSGVSVNYTLFIH